MAARRVQRISLSSQGHEGIQEPEAQGSSLHKMRGWVCSEYLLGQASLGYWLGQARQMGVLP